jgi:hypothetical protein
MNAAEILIAVRKAGAGLRVEGNSLFASHASRIAPTIKAAIRENKPQIIAALAKPICVVCNAPTDLWTLDTPTGTALVHQECAAFLPKPEVADLGTAYQAASPDCSVTIIELPQAQRYRKTFAALQMKPPALVSVERWQQAIEDGREFLAKWGEQAQALGWDSRDLFGLHAPPDKPYPSYSQLSRYDETGLVWLLQGREVVALTEAIAKIRNPDTDVITTYRRSDKPGYGPLGGSEKTHTL